jgi:hypothetical protein
MPNPLITQTRALHDKKGAEPVRDLRLAANNPDWVSGWSSKRRFWRDGDGSTNEVWRMAA